MKITKSQLKQIIKEELEVVLGEEMSPAELEAAKHEQCKGAIDYEKCMGDPPYAQSTTRRRDNSGGKRFHDNDPGNKWDDDPRDAWYEE